MNIEITADLTVHTISYNLSYVHFISIVQNLKYCLTCIHQPFSVTAVLTAIAVWNKKLFALFSFS